MSNIGDHNTFSDRAKRKLSKVKRTRVKKELNLRAALMTDLTKVLSNRGITIKNVLDIVDDLARQGWTKSEFQGRKWR